MKFDVTKLRKVIACDFDGCICETNYPDIIKPMPHAIWALNTLQQHGYVIIINTCRVGVYCDDAIDYLYNQGFVPDLVNENMKDRIKMFGADSKKISADIYIDDRNYGTVIDDLFWINAVDKLTSMAGKG
jgi:hypothetical protein